MMTEEMEQERMMREEKMRQLYEAPYSNENDDTQVEEEEPEVKATDGNGRVMNLVEIDGKMYIVPAEGSVWKDDIKEAS